jgi:two-component sensor histidine kinase
LIFPTLTEAQKNSSVSVSSTKNVAENIEKAKKLAPVYFDSALYFANASISLALKLKNENDIANAFSAKGLVFDYQSLLDSTLYYYDKAFAIRLKQKNGIELVKLYNNYGVAYFYQGMYDKALSFYIESLKQSEQLNDSAGIARSLNNMGLVYDKKGDFVTATRYYENSLKLKRLLHDDAGLLFPLSNLSDIAFLQKNYQRAEDYMLQNLKVSEKIKDTMQISISHGLLALIYAYMNNHQKSLTHLYVFEQLKYHVTDEFETTLLYYNIGKSYFILKNFIQAENYLLSSANLSKKLKQFDHLLKVYKTIQQMYQMQGRLNESLHYYDMFSTLNDSIYSVNQAVAISKIEQQYQWEKKEKEIDMLNLKIEKEKSQKRSWIFGFGFLGITGAMVTLFLIFYRRKSDELKIKNEQVESALVENEMLMKEMNHRVKNNLQMISSMLHLQKHYARNPEAALTLQETASRIRSISLIHQKLYAKDSVQQINVKPYIKELVQYIIQNFTNPKTVQCIFNVDEIFLEIEKAQSIGLIINELILNVLKHARTSDDTLKIDIILKSGDNSNFLTVKDNGNMIDQEMPGHKNSYGMQLIKSFTEKIDGKLEFKKNNGWEVTINW